MKAKTPQSMNLLLKPRAVFALSIILGLLIWLLSPQLTGRREPWDAKSNYYWIALLVAGFIPGCFCSRHFWRWGLGACLGQCAGLTLAVLRANESAGGLLPLGMILLIFTSVPSIAGAALGAGVHLLIRRLFSRNPP